MNYELIKRYVACCRLLVPRIDINKDGFVEEAELEIWIRHKMKKWEIEEDVDAIFRDLDTNNDNDVTWKEFMIRTYGFPEEGTVVDVSDWFRPYSAGQLSTVTNVYLKVVLGNHSNCQSLSDLHKKWERKNLEYYIMDDKSKWKHADQDKNGRLTRQEYEYFHHPKEHEVMITYVAMVITL